MKDDYIGIDYGMGTTNIDLSNRIHYGVINQNEVLQAWADSSEGEYPEPEKCETCLGTGCSQDEDGNDLDDSCPDCDGEGKIQDDETEAIAFTLDDGEYLCSQSSDDPDIFIMKSPFYTLCAYCSPCAPGAGYLMSPNPEGIKAYCFGHDWFDEEKAPYPVYRVSDETEVTE
jgi:hypothetical protein